MTASCRYEPHIDSAHALSSAKAAKSPVGTRNNAETASIVVKTINEIIILRDSREGGIFEMECSELCMVRLTKKLTFLSRKVACARKPKVHTLEDVVRYELKVSWRWGESFKRER